MKFFKSFLEFMVPDYVSQAQAPSIRKIMNVLTQVEADDISNYMMRCTIITEWLSPVRDPLNKEIWVNNTQYSDGVYFWSELHSHVIKTYRISLPEEFKAHVNKQIASGQDFSNLDSKILLEKEKMIFDELIKGQDEGYNIWAEGEPESLILDFDKILAARKSTELR